MTASLRAEIRRIAQDHVSGSTAIAMRAARVMKKAMGEGIAEEVARGLLTAQPRMASVRYVVRRALEDGVCADEEVARLSREAGDRAAKLIRKGSTVMTHSASAAVFTALCAASEVKVIATESRPKLEGVQQARRLRRAGIEVEVIVDAAIVLHLERTDLVLTGADAVTDEGVISKVGTSMLARAAVEAGVSRYAVCGSDKILAQGVRLPPEEAKPGGEIVRGMRASNYYFETTPLEWWTGIVTESGVIRPSRPDGRQ